MSGSPRRLAMPLGLLLVAITLGGVGAAGAEQPPGSPSDPPPEALLAELPFHPDAPPGLVVIDLAPPGSRPFVLELDTGAAASVLSPRVARALGVSIRPHKSTPYRRKTVLGRDLQFWVDTRRSDTGSATFEYGLLGGDFLDDYVVELDYPGRHVRFYDRKKFEVPEQASRPGEAIVAFRKRGTRLVVPIEIDGRRVEALLDTGSGATIIAGSTVREAGIQPRGALGSVTLLSVVGPTHAKVYRAESFELAGIDFPGQPIVIAPRGVYNLAGPSGCLLGTDTLGHFVVRIDYPRKRIWLRRIEGLPLVLFGEPLPAEQAEADDPAPQQPVAHGAGAE